jgi:hypothetical protein
VGNAAAQDFAVAVFTILAIALGAVTGLGADRSLAKKSGW